jgi:hypothetical protein
MKRVIGFKGEVKSRSSNLCPWTEVLRQVHNFIIPFPLDAGCDRKQKTTMLSMVIYSMGAGGLACPGGVPGSPVRILRICFARPTPTGANGSRPNGCEPSDLKPLPRSTRILDFASREVNSEWIAVWTTVDK